MALIETTNIPSSNEHYLDQLPYAFLKIFLKSQNFYVSPDEKHAIRTLLLQLETRLHTTIENVLRDRKVPFGPNEILLKIIPSGSLELDMYHCSEQINFFLIISSKLVRCQNEIYLFLRNISSNRCTILDDSELKTFLIHYENRRIILSCSVLSTEQAFSMNPFLWNSDQQKLRNTLIGDLMFTCHFNESTKVAVELSEESFRQALRILKMWAIRRNIFNNHVGLLDQYTLSILVSKTLTINPNANLLEMIQYFFIMFTTWRYPFLVQSDDESNQNSKPLDLSKPALVDIPDLQLCRISVGFKKWSKQVILQEIKFGAELIKAISEQKLKWKHLFKRGSYFARFDYFIVIVFCAGSSHDLDCVVDVLEPELFLLMEALETKVNGIEYVHVAPRFYTQNYCKLNLVSPFCLGSFSGMQLKSSGGKISDNYKIGCVQQILSKFRSYIIKKLIQREFLKVGMQIKVQVVGYRDLKHYFSKRFLKNDRKRFSKEKRLYNICRSR